MPLRRLNCTVVSNGARRVALVTLGCARNEVDSEELAARLGDGDWELTDESDADVLVVNTCGFVDAAKKDSIDTVLAAADTGKKVVAVGCLAERYGAELAASAARGRRGARASTPTPTSPPGSTTSPPAARSPRTRRATGARCCRSRPVHRPAAAAEVAVPGPRLAADRRPRARRLDDVRAGLPEDRLRLRPALHVLRHPVLPRLVRVAAARRRRWPRRAGWPSSGARELVLVSENSTSYGKDLGDLRALEKLLPQLAAVDGIERIRVSYLQPAELRPALLETIAGTPGVAPYFDLSFQHASPDVLRRMKRFGSTDAFLDILARARAIAPDAGARRNVIVGFPGETEDDLAELERFLTEARLDVVGVFGYSDEDGTEAEQFDGKLSERRDRGTGRAHQRARRRADDPACRGPHRRARRGAGRGRRGGRSAGRRTRGRRPTAPPGCHGRRSSAARSSPPWSSTPRASTWWPSPRAPDGEEPATPEPRAGRRRPDRRSAQPGVGVEHGQRADGVPVAARPGVPRRAVPRPGRPHRLAADRDWAVFAVASITDRFDGELARKRSLVTEFGKLADPIADKALVGAALIGLSLLGDLPWWVTVVMLVREVGVTVLRFWVIRHGVIAASRGGKVKTLLQAVAIGLFVLPAVGLAARRGLGGHGGGDRARRRDRPRLRRTRRAAAPPVGGRRGDLNRSAPDSPRSAQVVGRSRRLRCDVRRERTAPVASACVTVGRYRERDRRWIGAAAVDDRGGLRHASASPSGR